MAQSGTLGGEWHAGCFGGGFGRFGRHVHGFDWRAATQLVKATDDNKLVVIHVTEADVAAAASGS